MCFDVLSNLCPTNAPLYMCLRVALDWCDSAVCWSLLILDNVCSRGGSLGFRLSSTQRSLFHSRFLLFTVQPFDLRRVG